MLPEAVLCYKHRACSLRQANDLIAQFYHAGLAGLFPGERCGRPCARCELFPLQPAYEVKLYVHGPMMPNYVYAMPTAMISMMADADVAFH